MAATIYHYGTRRNNQSIGFDINARAIADNLNADLNIQLFAYGKSVSDLAESFAVLAAGSGRY